jgi:hypothetical protein
MRCSVARLCERTVGRRSRCFERVAAYCTLLRIVSWLPSRVRSWRVARATLNGGWFNGCESEARNEPR